MKVFNLSCEHDHVFEGWFDSESAYQEQLDAQMLSCPICDSAQIKRLPSAPRLNLAQATPVVDKKPAESQQMVAPSQGQLQAMWLHMVRHIQANTEDVGEKFAEEARRIHYQEAQERGIRGVATPDEAAELAEEGIDVMPLPIPAAAKDTLQ